MITSKLKDLMEFCRQNDRVCPHPVEWERLWRILRERGQKQARWNPPRPLILAAWWETSILEKRECLKQHIRWAYEHEIFDAVNSFIRALSEDQWFHASQTSAAIESPDKSSSSVGASHDRSIPFKVPSS